MIIKVQYASLLCQYLWGNITQWSARTCMHTHARKGGHVRGKGGVVVTVVGDIVVLRLKRGLM